MAVTVGARSNDDTRRVARAPVTRASAAPTSVLVRSASSMSRVSAGSPRSRQNGAADTAVLYCADGASGPAPARGPTPNVGDREPDAPESAVARESARATA